MTEPKIVPISTRSLNKSIFGWGKIVLITSLLLILYATLFPFYFSEEITAGFELRLTKTDFLGDGIRNILLFLPFGFGLGCLIENRSFKRVTSIVIVLIVSFGLSLTVETLQLFLSERTSTVRDIFANSIGGAIGCVSWNISKPKILRYLSVLMIKSRECLSIPKLTVGFISYATLTFLLSIPLQSTTNFSNWDPAFWLVVGNEQTGNRPWRGQISEIYLADRAISKSEVARVFAENSSSTVIGDSLVASYQLTAGEAYVDRTQNLPELTWYPETPKGNKGNDGVLLTPSHWLETASPATFLTQRIRNTSQFTSIVTMATANTTQFNPSGPAVITSLSGSPPQNNNFTLGQVGSSLNFLLRTPLTGEHGVQPILEVPNIFVDSNIHQLIITYDGSVLRIYKDRLNHSYSLELTPGSALFWQLLYLPHLPLIGGWTIHPNVLSNKLYKILYYGLIFIPLGFILGLIAKLSKLGSNHNRLLIFVVLLSSCGILELILIAVSSKFLSIENLLLSLIIMSSAMVLTIDN